MATTEQISQLTMNICLYELINLTQFNQFECFEDYNDLFLTKNKEKFKDKFIY